MFLHNTRVDEDLLKVLTQQRRGTRFESAALMIKYTQLMINTRNIKSFSRIFEGY